ncbi:MAG TPA: outer membrane beta-barrel protein [Vicinamibacterales bacterium]
MPLFSRLTLVFAAAALAVPSLAHAGDPPVGVQAFAAIDFNQFAASKTYKAVFGSSSMPGFGGGADVTNIWKHLFVRVAVTHLNKTGSRVFVDAGQVFTLNEPAKLTLTPVEVGAGWRFVTKNARFTPYAGGSVLIESYKVVYSSSPDLNESETFTGSSFFGGVDFAITKLVFVGGEAQLRVLPNALQSPLSSSVANVYNEKDGGGFTARIAIGVKFGK